MEVAMNNARTIKRYTEAVLRGDPIRPEAFFEA